VIRVEEADGLIWGMILVDGVVARAPFERYRGASLDQIREWSLYGGHAISEWDIEALTSESGSGG
jgi:hypothetical protein